MRSITVGVILVALTACAARAESDSDAYRFIGGEKIQLKFNPANAGEIAEQVVNDNGNISLPTGSTVNIKGKTAAEAQKIIADQVMKDTTILNVKVTLSVLDYPPRKVYVAGDVRKPGSTTLTPGVPVYLLSVLQDAGGVSESGDPTRVNIVHTDSDGKRSSVVIDTTKLAQPGSADLGPKLLPGDTVLVPRGDHFVFSGEFNRVGMIPVGDLHMEPGEKMLLSRVIAGLGGLKKEADAKKLKIFRLKPDGTRDVITPFENGVGKEDPLLKNGDIVEVTAKPQTKESTLASSVSIIGKGIKTPGTYPIGENGLKLSKLVMLAGGLSEFANGKKVTINRPGSGIIKIVDVDAILKGNWDEDIELKDGDIVNVKERAF
ncbi:MAG TPA: SLBB domain-containing protein [Planctomycetota bacterium]|nr:SLBB domain-containing protein [Planctomycetota bacterium]